MGFTEQEGSQPEGTKSPVLFTVSRFFNGEVGKEYIAGVFSGLGKVAAGHPFDTIKSRVQSGKFGTPLEALMNTVRLEGVATLYQGVSMPTFGVCFIGGIIFYTNSVIRKILQPDKSVPLTYQQMFLAGSGAGFVAGLAVPPIEVMKIHLQVANKRDVKLHPEQPTTLLRVFQSVGLRHMYSGISATIIREVGTFGIFFPMNEYNKALIATGLSGRRHGQIESRELGVGWRIAAAWVAGVCCWLPVYPIDVIKTWMQLHPTKFANIFACARYLAKNEGSKVFWRGLSPCLLRAGPAYSAQYLVYEYASGALRGSK